ncbi:MAG TPA: class I SAM-dependent methyltransferase [Solirubrobacterales bacterium]
MNTPDPRQCSHYDRLYGGEGFGYERQRGMWTRWVRQYYIGSFGLKRGERLLDIPCGDGFWASLFDGQGLRVSGVDVSEGGIEVARRRYPGIDFRVGDAEGPLPYEPGEFDVVFSRGISHLHREDLGKESTRQMARTLMSLVSPKGLLLVSLHTRRDHSGSETHAFHPVSALVELFESVGDPYRVEVVDDYVQIGVQHRGGPRTAGGVRSTSLLDPRAIRRRARRLLPR